MSKESHAEVITTRFLTFLEQHINKVVNGDETGLFALKQVASEVAISHQHLSETVKKISGYTPCYLYDEKIIQ